MAPGPPPAASSAALPDGLLQPLLAVSLTGVNVLSPCYGPTGALEDFALDYLNPAAQRMTGLPERPGGTLRTHYPHTLASGIFAYYRRVFETQQPETFEVNYQADGLDNYFRLAAQRHEGLLVVSFTDTADQPRTAVETALRAAQAAERAARAEAEAQRQQLHEVLHQSPIAIALLDGPEYRIRLANPTVCELWARPLEDLLGRPLLGALPELQGQGVDDLLDGVLRTGEPFFGTELPFELLRHGRRETIYFNFVYQPQRNTRGDITGVLVVATDVTAIVTARHRVEAQERRTAELNEELAAANEEIRANNDELHRSQADLLRLNQELEARVQARTRDADAARAEAEEQRNRLERLFRQAPALINTFTGPDHVLTLVHPLTERLLPGRRLLGLPRREALPELPEEQHAPLDHVFRTGEAVHQSERLTRLDRFQTGELSDVYLDVSYQPLYDPAGRIEGVMSFAVDVTDQVLARQEREAQREQLQAVFAQAPVAVCLFRGENSVFDVVNPPMAEMLGHPLEALVGHPFFEVMPELRAQGLPELLAAVRRTGTPYVAKEQAIQLLRHQPGAPGHYNFVYQPLFDAQHQVTGIVCVVIDVSEQVAARRVVEAREESFRLMADNAPAMLWVTDPNGQCTYLNQQWYAYTGQTAAEALGMGWTQAVHPDDASAAGTAFLDANARRVPFYFLYRLRRRDGRYRWAIDQGLPRFGPDGAFEGIVGTVVDVHEQKLAELALQKLTKKLRKSRDQTEALNAELHASNQQLTRTNVDLDNFIYTASHDLKAPIANLEGLLHLLRDELPAPTAQAPHVAPVFTRLFNSVERFKRTIDHLTEVSKLQKEHAPAADLVHLATVVEDVRQDLQPLLEEAGAQLDVALAATPPVRFAEKNLRSVVYNLLSNAVKYRAPDRAPRVEVRAHVRDGHTVLEVHDNGLGLAPAQVPRLFTMFQRLHDHVEGTGIGLFMVKRMVDNAGGRIEVHSQLGAGTTFSVHLPHAAPLAAPSAA